MLRQVYQGMLRVIGPSSQRCSLQTDYVRALSSVNGPEIIKVPLSMVHRIKEIKKRTKRKEKEKFTVHSRKGNKSEAIISCKREQFNHYRGQTYPKFAEIPLASKGWSHRKSAGDYFTINSFGENPALTTEDESSDFGYLGLTKDIQEEMKKLGYTKPTNIQASAIPHVLDGKNTLITAETGNGKTISFLAPMLQQIAMMKRKYGVDQPLNTPFGLIIVPGRELAEQIQIVGSSLGEELGINVELVKGGRTKKLMKNPTVKVVDLLVATIGALSKLTSTGLYDTSLVKHIAIDEADSLFDDSFNEKIIHYLSRFPIQGARKEESNQTLALSGCQLTLVSATMPRSLDTILDPVVDLDSLERISTHYLHRIMPHVPQRFFRVNNRTRSEKFLELIKEDKAKGVPVIIFSNLAKTSDWISLLLNEEGIPCVNLNGEMAAVIRHGRFEEFQKGKVLALSCTDLASRGLDTIRAGHIINFDFPTFISDYIHRCGRTGRVGGSKGLITSLVHRTKEIELVQKIEYSARKIEEFHNVNANIKRALFGKAVDPGEIDLKNI